MKHKFSKLNIENYDQEIMLKASKRRRLNGTETMNKFFQKKFNVSFNLKSIIDEYLCINPLDEFFCLYCEKSYLEKDTQECNICDKIICEKCNNEWWSTVIDYREEYKDDMIMSCCQDCINKYQHRIRDCDICKTKYIPIKKNISDIECKVCKKYICIICMPRKFNQIKTQEQNVHIGRGKYKKFKDSYCTDKIYCTNCFFENYKNYKNKKFVIL